MLLYSLDTILAEELSHNLDAVEPKFFGLGSESYVTGSMEFYTGYAISRGVLLTLDSGHFHSTETIADKISSLLIYLDRLLLHVSRGVRWDSDHVVTFNEDLQAIAQEIVHRDALERVHIGLDYFDASINRVAAWTIGARNTLKSLLMALLEPRGTLQQYEREGDYSSRSRPNHRAAANLGLLDCPGRPAPGCLRRRRERPQEVPSGRGAGPVLPSQRLGVCPGTRSLPH